MLEEGCSTRSGSVGDMGDSTASSSGLAMRSPPNAPLRDKSPLMLVVVGDVVGVVYALPWTVVAGSGRGVVASRWLSGTRDR